MDLFWIESQKKIRQDNFVLRMNFCSQNLAQFTLVFEHTDLCMFLYGIYYMSRLEEDINLFS